MQSKRHCDVDHAGGLADATLLVRDAEDPHSGRAWHLDLATGVEDLDRAPCLLGKWRVLCFP
jgi:hypothetical protein